MVEGGEATAHGVPERGVWPAGPAGKGCVMDEVWGRGQEDAGHRKQLGPPW